MEVAPNQPQLTQNNNLTLYLKENFNPHISDLVGNHNQWIRDNLNPAVTVIETEADCLLYADKLDYAKRALKTVEAKRLEITKPLRDAVTKTNDFIKSSLENDLNTIINQCNTIILTYKKKKIEEERKRQEEERKRIEALKEETARKLAEQNKLNPEILDSLNKTAQEAQQIIAQQADIDSRTKLSTSNGSLNITSRFVFDEQSNLMQLLEYIVRTNPLAINYVMFNTVAINKDLRPTKERPNPRQVPGINFKEEYNTRSN